MVQRKAKMPRQYRENLLRAWEARTQASLTIHAAGGDHDAAIKTVELRIVGLAPRLRLYRIGRQIIRAIEKLDAEASDAVAMEARRRAEERRERRLSAALKTLRELGFALDDAIDGYGNLYPLGLVSLAVKLADGEASEAAAKQDWSAMNRASEVAHRLATFSREYGA